MCSLTTKHWNLYWYVALAITLHFRPFQNTLCSIQARKNIRNPFASNETTKSPSTAMMSIHIHGRWMKQQGTRENKKKNHYASNLANLQLALFWDKGYHQYCSLLWFYFDFLIYKIFLLTEHTYITKAFRQTWHFKARLCPTNAAKINFTIFCCWYFQKAPTVIIFNQDLKKSVMWPNKPETHDRQVCI